MTADATLAKRRTSYLHGVADAALAHEDEAERERAAGAETEAAEAKRRAEARPKAIAAERQYFAAIAKMDRGARMTAEGYAEAEREIRQLKATRAATGEKPPRALDSMGAPRRWSEWISAIMCAVIGPGRRLGRIQFVPVARRATQDWLADEKLIVGELELTEQELTND